MQIDFCRLGLGPVLGGGLVPRARFRGALVVGRDLFWVLALMTMVGCASPTDELGPEYTFDLPQGFPAPKVPADNPMSASKIELGGHFLSYF